MRGLVVFALWASSCVGAILASGMIIDSRPYLHRPAAIMAVICLGIATCIEAYADRHKND